MNADSSHVISSRVLSFSKHLSDFLKTLIIYCDLILDFIIIIVIFIIIITGEVHFSCIKNEYCIFLLNENYLQPALLGTKVYLGDIQEEFEVYYIIIIKSGYEVQKYLKRAS